MSFLFQSLLTVGLPLVGVPLLIHLINLRRHRRIRWAAMEFLLESEKRNKKWILLRQFLLLLLRTSAVALVVLMLAGPVLRSQWGQIFGSGTTHHLILLDDSYSMADRWEQTSALDEAKRVIAALVDQAAQQPHGQKLTLLRFSQAKDLSAGALPDVDDRPLDQQLLDELEVMLGKMTVAESDAGPIEVLQAAARLPEADQDETRIIYLISDFRAPQWKEDAQLRQHLLQLRKNAQQMHLVGCVDHRRANLAITQLGPESGIRAAGVETWMELSVANYGEQPALAVVVRVEQDGHQLPSVQFDEIPAGEQATRRFRVTFAESGAHQLQAALETDTVKTDNRRYFACHVPSQFPVLLIDGSRGGDDGYYLRTALSPGGTSNSGWSPRTEPASFLRQHELLDQFAAICLLDLPRLDDSEVFALQEYVEGGGGLAIFVGPQTQPSFFNDRFYREGTGLAPVPLDVPTQLLRMDDLATPDVVVSKHPIFEIFSGQRNSFLSVAAVDFYYAIDPAWQPPEQGDTQVLAHLRNGAPFVVAKQFGAGRTVLQLSKLSPQQTELGRWNNWSLNPVFPVYANELVGYLSSTRRRHDAREAGQELGIELPAVDYEPEVAIRPPRALGGETITVYPKAENGTYRVDAPSETRSGVWQVDLQPRDGGQESRLLAFNVPTGEGELQFVDQVELQRRLEGVDYVFSLARDMTTNGSELAGFQLGDTMLYMLLVVLVFEQLLAYQASYHSPPAKKV